MSIRNKIKREALEKMMKPEMNWSVKREAFNQAKINTQHFKRDKITSNSYLISLDKKRIKK